MIKQAANDDRRAIALHISTGTKAATGKEYIYCELSYRDKKTGRAYNKVFAATRYDDASKLFYTLYNGAIKPAEIPGLFI